MSDETPIADKSEVLAGENIVIIKSGDGRIGNKDVLVNGQKQTFATGKEITVSDAQLDVLRNSSVNIEEVKVSASTKKADKVSPSEAGGEEGSKPPAAEPASNVNDGGNTTTATTPATDTTSETQTAANAAKTEAAAEKPAAPAKKTAAKKATASKAA